MPCPKASRQKWLARGMWSYRFALLPLGSVSPEITPEVQKVMRQFGKLRKPQKSHIHKPVMFAMASNSLMQNGNSIEHQSPYNGLLQSRLFQVRGFRWGHAK